MAGTPLAVVFDILAIDQASHVFKKVGAAATAAGAEAEGGMKQLGASLVGTVAVAAAAATVLSAKMASDFQSSMLLLNTQAGASTDEVKKLSAAVLDLAPKVGFGPDALALSLYHIESVGLRGKQAMDVLRLAAEGAAVGHANLEQTTNALTAAVASGMQGTEDYGAAMGKLNAIVGAGDMKMSDLNDAMSTGILVTMKQYGVTLNDVGAALATFGDNNVRGQLAATQLRMAVQALSKPAAGGTAALASIGLSAQNLRDDLQKGGLNLALTDLHEHLVKSGKNGTEAGQFLTEAFGKRAGSGLQILNGQMDRFHQKLDVMGHTDSKTFSDAWVAVQGTFKQSLNEMIAQVETWAIRFGTLLLPVLTRVMRIILDDVVPAFAKLGEWLHPFFAFLQDNAGPILTVVGGALAGLVAPMILTGIGAIVAMFAALLSPAVLVGAAIGLLVALFQAAYDSSLPLREAVASLVSAFHDFVDVFNANNTGGISGIFDGLVAAAVAAGPQFLTALSNIALELWAWIESAAAPIAERLLKWGQAFVDWIAPLIPPMLVALGGVLVSMLDWIWNIGLPAIGTQLLVWGQAFIDWIAPRIIPMLEALGGLLLSLANWISDTALPYIWNHLQEWGKALVDWVAPRIPPLLGELGALMGTVVGWVLFTGLPLLVGALLKLSWELVKWVAPRIPDLINEFFMLVQNILVWVVMTGIPMLFRGMYDMGKGMLDGFSKSFHDSPIVQAVGDFFSRVMAEATNRIDEGINVLKERVNNDLIDPINSITGFFGVPAIPHMSMTAITGIGFGQGAAYGGAPHGAAAFASGGLVNGAGDGTSDSILARISHGEYIVQQSSVAKYGPDFMHALNAGQLPGFSLGGLVDKGIDSVGGAVSAVGGWITDEFVKAMDGRVDALISFAAGAISSAVSSPKILHDSVSGIVHHVGDGLKSFVDKLMGGGGWGGAGGAAQWSDVVSTALQMLGQPLSLLSGVLSLINSESGGDPNAINLTDSNAAAGHPSRGLMQTIPSTFEAYRSPLLPDNIVDPLANVYAGINYALHNYGPGMLAAGGRHSAGGGYVGYDTGGLLPSGGVGMNRSGSPERILSPAQTAAFERLADDLGSGGGMAQLAAEIRGLRADVRSLPREHQMLSRSS